GVGHARRESAVRDTVVFSYDQPTRRSRKLQITIDELLGLGAAAAIRTRRSHAIMIDVRLYQEADLPGMQALNLRAMSAGETTGRGADGMPRELGLSFEGKLGYWVATESDSDAEIVGMIALRTPTADAPPASIANSRRVSEIVSFRVSPDHQRKGIGSLL